MSLTPKQERFVAEYLIDMNASQAAVRAGYSARTAGALGFENLKKPEIAAAIQSAQKKRSARVEITQDRVLLEIARLAFFDPRKMFGEDGRPLAVTELDDDTAAAVVGLDVLEEWAGSGEDRVLVGHVKKYKIADKGGALALAARHLGMLKDKVEHSGGLTLEALVAAANKKG